MGELLETVRHYLVGPLGGMLVQDNKSCVHNIIEVYFIDRRPAVDILAQPI